MSTHQERNAPALAGHECSDKVYLVTGGTSGVGRATARGLARLGARVVLLCRSEPRGRAALDAIARETKNDRGELVVGDLASLSSVRAAAAEVRRRFDRLDGLAHLAGMLSFTPARTPEGLDEMLVVNVLSAFVLTEELRPLLEASRPARVLTVAGRPSFLRNPRLDFEALERALSGLGGLAQTLFAKVGLAFELATRLEGTGVTSVTFHPGSIKGSTLGRGTAPLWMRVLGRLLFEPFGSEECPIGVHLATSPEVASTTGVFFDDRGRVVPFVREAFPREQTERLWALAARLSGTRPAG
ncbi:MAG: SDR family NAD(P)-dependent oxidoreductase [Minicystis sp.]